MLSRFHCCPRTLAAFSLVVAASAASTSIGDDTCFDAGQVTNKTKVTEGTAGFTGNLDIQDEFGVSVSELGDLNADGVADVAVGARWDDDGGLDRGAVWILLLKADRTVFKSLKISDTVGGFAGVIQNADYFGSAIANIGDLDGDGVADLAVGAAGDDIAKGAVWILFMKTNGTVKGFQKIAPSVGGFTGELTNTDSFGEGVTSLGDLDGDGITDIAVGAPLDDDGQIGNEWANRGAVWILFLNANGTVKSHQKISDWEGGFEGALDDFDNFGKDVDAIGDVDGDGVVDLAVGAWVDSESDRTPQTGAAWILFLNSDGTVKGNQKINGISGGFAGELDASDFFGITVSGMGDLDADGVPDVGVGAMQDDDGGDGCGAVWILFLNSDGSVKSHMKLSNTSGGLQGSLQSSDWFGTSISPIGDIDGDGKPEFAVGTMFYQTSTWGQGGMWILSLDACKPSTVGDLDSDGDVDSADLAILLGGWGQCRASCAADLDEDGVVGASDLALLLGNWS